eukprot:NODE_17644_length_933_cov_2.832506.p2 GENE.NODE_17644_length_933_cov_2.832506~~NODE_17644_length_933_cov_2.832506.p2  ORF type:complete len:104 (-),score=12.18 NODE_17644_length_933_cov_2.832506:504-815(-)
MDMAQMVHVQKLMDAASSYALHAVMALAQTAGSCSSEERRGHALRRVPRRSTSCRGDRASRAVQGLKTAFTAARELTTGLGGLTAAAFVGAAWQLLQRRLCHS